MNEAITGPAAIPRARMRERPLAILGAAALVLASVGLFFVSRGKWSDAIIDSGREWIVPDALARGELLYRDVVYWFGPFTPYFHALFFRLFGSSFATLVVAGVVGSIGVLVALFLALRSVTGRREAALWTGLAIPALIFMPNAGGSILGMGYRGWHAAAFALLAIAFAARPVGERGPVRAVAVGLLCALAGLCRTEWGLGALAASFAAILLRGSSPSARLREISAAVAAFVLLFGGVLASFVAVAGPKAVLEDGHILFSGLPAETREFLVAYSGIRDWRNGILELLYSAAMWAGALLLLQILAIRSRDRRRVLRKLPLLATVFVLLGVSAALGGAAGTVLFSAAPVVCITAAVLALARRTPSSAGLLGFGIAGALLSYRRPFHIGDAAYVGPPLLFAFICAAGIVYRLVDREEDSAARDRLQRYAGAAVLLLVVIAFAGRTLGYRDDERIALPGTQGMLSARPELVRRFDAVARAIRRESRSGEGLVVFPEGEILNYLTGRPNPIRHKLYIPGYLTERNEGEILAELERARPAVVVSIRRDTGEYGPGTFGSSYGDQIRRWITEKYDGRRIGRFERTGRLGSWAAVAIRK